MLFIRKKERKKKEEVNYPRLSQNLPSGGVNISAALSGTFVYNFRIEPPKGAFQA